MNAPVVTNTRPLSPIELTEIADRIRGRARRAIMDIILTGQDLARVKATLGHGKFGGWVDHEFNMTDRTVRNYMNAAAWAEGKTEMISDLPPATLFLLAAKSTPDEIQAEVVSDLKVGKPIETRKIEDRIKEARSAHRQAATAIRRKRQLTPATIRRQEREEERLEAERQVGEAWCEQATTEICSILLRGRDRAELDRLVRLLQDDRWRWRSIREDLAKALVALIHGEIEVDQTSDDEVSVEKSDEDDPLAIPPWLKRERRP